MDTILIWQIEWIVAVQAAAGAPWTQLAQAFSFIGTEYFFLLVMPAILWCYDAPLGVRAGLALMTSATVNGILKLAFHMPRPQWIDARVQALAEETSYGLPSGHAQNSVVLWGYLAYRIRRWWATLGAVVLILGISFSRIFLGVHFPTDVLGGWIVGAVILALFVWLEDPIARWLKSRPLGMRLVVVALGSISLLGIGWLVLQGTSPGGPWPFGPEASPHAIQGLIPPTAALFGLALGAVLLADWGKFDGRLGGVGKRAGRLAMGLGGVALLYIGLNLLLPEGQLWRFLRYGLVGFWIAYGAPRVFVAARLDR